jgi:hypothetical protein
MGPVGRSAARPPSGSSWPGIGLAIRAGLHTGELVVGSGIAMDDLGTRPLKGVDGSWQLFAARP